MNFLLALILTINLALTADIVFVANEGAFGASNGSVSMIFDDGTTQETEALGDVVQSVEVYGDKLIVLVNNSHKMKIFDIHEDGLSMPGIEVSTGESSPRELVVVNGKVYFTNFNSQDVKVFDLFTYSFETSIAIDGLPEDIEYDGDYLWVTVPHSDAYFSTGNTVVRIDPASNTVVETIEVGMGPQQITFSDGDAYISRTFYDDTWSTFHGTTKLEDFDGSTETHIYNYGAGAPCGGAIVKHQNSVYRSFDGGLAEINDDLSLSAVSIGNFDQSQVYHVEKIDDMFWFSITNFQDLNEVHVLDEQGATVASYQTGLNPGDFAVWNLCSYNGDMDVTDIVSAVDSIMSDSEYDCRDDMNSDEVVDILDIIRLVNEILDI